MQQEYDLMVVGGGPGGYVAAIRAAQLGFRTALVEREHLGGICLNWGCIPTKALLRGAEVAHILEQADTFGFEVDNVRFQLDKLVAHSRAVADRLSGGIGYLMQKNGIAVIDGEARISDKCRLSVTDNNGRETTYRADHIILATGARPKSLPGIDFDGERVWSSREAMTPPSLPEKLLVIGAGAIGAEFASLYRDLGSEVTLVEALDRILPVEDAEISAFAEQAFRQRGIDIHTGSTVASLETAGDGVEAIIQSPDGEKRLAVDRAILAVGITGNIENLGLDSLGVATERGFIVTDDHCRTNLVGLYAIGDVAGAPWLAHKASHEGVYCVERIAGVAGAHPLDKTRIPACTYCRPQVASVGLTEDEARARGRPLRVGHFKLAANGKALAMDDSQGFVKTLFDEATGELLGAHMIGPEVTEQIQGFAIGRQLEATEAELIQTIFPHPTLSESMHEAVLDSLGIAIHQ